MQADDALSILAEARATGPEPDWSAADAPRVVDRDVVPEAWRDLPPVHKKHIDARHDSIYCFRLAEWLLDNIFDRHDALCMWDSRAGSWFRDKTMQHSRDTIANALVNCFGGTGPDAHRLLGSYYTDPRTGLGRHTCLDFDSHNGEDSKSPLRATEAVLIEHGIPYFVARSKGGGGFHVRVMIEEPVPPSVTRNLGLEIKRLAKLDPKTEVFPKSANAHPNFGTQVAVPGSRFFRETRSGSFLMRSVTHEEIEFKDWLSFLESVPKATVAQLKTFGKKIGVDLWTANTYKFKLDFQSTVSVVAGRPAFRGHDDVSRFLKQHGLASRDCGGSGQWTHRFRLDVCANARAHGTPRLDGAAVLFNEANGDCKYTCWHTGCKDFNYTSFLKSLGHQVAFVPIARPSSSVALPVPVPPPVPIAVVEALEAPKPEEQEPSPEPWSDPRDEPNEDVEVKIDLRARLRTHSRARIASLDWLASHHFAQMQRERKRMKSIAACGRMATKKDCWKEHGIVHSQVHTCGSVRGCLYCASRVFAARRLDIITKWPDVTHVVLFDPKDGLWRTDASAALHRVRERGAHWRKWAQRRRIPLRRWVTGLHRGAFFFGREDEQDAEYLMDDLRARGLAEHVTVLHLTPTEAADLVYDLEMEPAECLGAVLDMPGLAGLEAAVNYPFLVDDARYRCTAGNKIGEKLPWLTEDQIIASRQAAATERRKASGEPEPDPDPRSCPVVRFLPDGSKRACGCPLRSKVFLDERLIHVSQCGAPGWLAASDALDAHAIESEHRSEQVHQT